MMLDRPKGYVRLDAEKVTAMESFRWMANYLSLDVDTRLADEIMKWKPNHYTIKDKNYYIAVFVKEELGQTIVSYQNIKSGHRVSANVDLKTFQVEVIEEYTI